MGGRGGHPHGLHAGYPMNLNQISRALYRAGRITRDARAVERSLETGSPAPIAHRLVRKALYRGFGKVVRKSGL